MIHNPTVSLTQKRINISLLNPLVKVLLSGIIEVRSMALLPIRRATYCWCWILPISVHNPNSNY